MATKANAKQSSGQSPNNRSSGSGFYIPPPPNVVNQNDEGSYLKLLIVLIVVMLLLPLFLYLMASMYFDILVIKQEVKSQQTAIRKLLKKDE